MFFYYLILTFYLITCQLNTTLTPWSQFSNTLFLKFKMTNNINKYFVKKKCPFKW